MRGWQWVMGAGVLGMGVVLCPWPTGPGTSQTMGEMISLLVTKQRPNVFVAAPVKSPPVLAAAGSVLRPGVPWAPISSTQADSLTSRSSRGDIEEAAVGTPDSSGILGKLGRGEEGTGLEMFPGSMGIFGWPGPEFTFNPVPGMGGIIGSLGGAPKIGGTPVPRSSGSSLADSHPGLFGGSAFDTSSNPWIAPRSSGGSHGAGRTTSTAAPPKASVPEAPSSSSSSPSPTPPSSGVDSNPKPPIPTPEPPKEPNPPLVVITPPALPDLPKLPDLPLLPGLPELGKPGQGDGSGSNTPVLGPGSLLDSLFGQVFGALAPDKNTGLFPPRPPQPASQKPGEGSGENVPGLPEGGQLPPAKLPSLPVPGEGGHQPSSNSTRDVQRWMDGIFTDLLSGPDKKPTPVPQPRSDHAGHKAEDWWHPPGYLSPGQDRLGQGGTPGDPGKPSREQSHNPGHWGMGGWPGFSVPTAPVPGSSTGQNSGESRSASPGSMGWNHSDSQSSAPSPRSSDEGQAARSTSWSSPAAKSGASSWSPTSSRNSASSRSVSGGTSESASASPSSARSASSLSAGQGLGSAVSHLLGSLTKSLSHH